MFNTEYIYELISGQLSNDGYKHILRVIASFVRKYNWPKVHFVKNEGYNNKDWSIDEIKELTHQFIEWSLHKGKFDNLNKIPESYLSYYFAQILISFVADHIKKEQRKEGLSFEKCRELVISICEDEYSINKIAGIKFVFKQPFSKEEVKPFEDSTNALKYLSKIPIKVYTKHFRPLVKLAIEDIFNLVEFPISVNKLTEIVFNLFDQKAFINKEMNCELPAEIELENSIKKYDRIIDKLIEGLTILDSFIILKVLFQNQTEQSYLELAKKFNVPRSTLHHKVDSFKKKIASSYTPEDEKDGIYFIQCLAQALDKISK